MENQLNQQPVNQQPVAPVMGQVPGQVPASPIPTTTPETEQIIVKLQELEQRIGDVELDAAQDNGSEVEGKYEKLFKKERLEKFYRRKLEELTGTPEPEKDKKDQDIGPEATKDVPTAQTSEIQYDDGGTKTGAPVAGKETGLDEGRPAEKDAIAKVPKPASEFPKEPIIKNALENDKGVPDNKDYSEEPEEMKDEDEKKIPDNKSDGLEEQYKYVKEKLAGRKSVVSVDTSKESPFRETYLGAKDNTNSVIKEYLNRAKVRI